MFLNIYFVYLVNELSLDIHSENNFYCYMVLNKRYNMSS
jgi:hypothetical protein